MPVTAFDVTAHTIGPNKLLGRRNWSWLLDTALWVWVEYTSHSVALVKDLALWHVTGVALKSTDGLVRWWWGWWWLSDWWEPSVSALLIGRLSSLPSVSHFDLISKIVTLECIESTWVIILGGATMGVVWMVWIPTGLLVYIDVTVAWDTMPATGNVTTVAIGEHVGTGWKGTLITHNHADPGGTGLGLAFHPTVGDHMDHLTLTRILNDMSLIRKLWS